MTSSVNPFDADELAFGGMDPRTAVALLAAAGDIALVIDASGMIRDVAVGSGDAHLEGATEWIGRAWVDTVTAETRMKIDTLLREVALGGVSKRCQVNHTVVDGADLPVAYTALRVGPAGALVAVGRDMRHVSALQQRLVESQQAMERDYWRLRHVETRYRMLFQIASDGILVIDSVSLKVLDANRAAGAFFEEPPDRLIGRSFPFGVSQTVERQLNELLYAARSSGRSGDVRVSLGSSEREYNASASCFRQDASTLLLVRLASTASAGSGLPTKSPARLLDLLERSPDGFVVTDLDGQILTANRSFLDTAEVVTEEQIRDRPLGSFIGRPGADLPVFLGMLRKNGAVRLIATTARGAQGTESEVEVSAVWVPDGEEPCIGFAIRDIGRRLAAGPQGARVLTRAVEELTGLVGRVFLRDLVRDTVDLVERHFIEAALELTHDNRTSAAEVLGVSRQSLYVKLRRHRLTNPSLEREDNTLS